MSNGITVHRPAWSTDLFPLICGIANAGGGRIIIPVDENRSPFALRNMRRPFESIPSTVQQKLGLACSAEPAVESAALCLEVGIPASLEPVAYEGTCYLYEDGCNRISNAEEIRGKARQKSYIDNDGRRIPNAKKKAAGRTRESTRATSRPTFEERSVAAADELEMTLNDEYVLKVLATNGRVPAPKVASLLNVSESTVRRSLRRLKELGFIKRVGSNKAGYWKVVR